MNAAVFVLLLLDTSPESVALEVLGQRLAMKSDYTIRYNISGEYPDKKSSFPIKSSATIQLWRSGKKLRVDYFNSSREPKKPDETPGSRQVVCHNCVTDGFAIVTDILPLASAVSSPVQFQDMRKLNTDYHGADFDWRYFGLEAISQRNYKLTSQIRTFGDIFKFPGVQFSEVTYNNKNCLFAKYIQVKNSLPVVQMQVWLSKVDGYNPIRIEWIFESNGNHKRVVDVTWQKNDKYYFPKTFHFTLSEMDKVKTRETITIERADFESPIDPKVFTLQGLGLNDGQTLMLPEIKKSSDYPLWQNGKIDYSMTNGQRHAAATAVQLPHTEDPNPGQNANYPVEPKTSYSLIVGIAAGVLSVLTIGYTLVKRWSQNRS